MLKATHFTYKNIIFWYILFFAVMTFQFWFNGDVIALHRQYAEFGLVDTSGATQVETKKYRDVSNFFIPEINTQMNGLHSGWLTLWTNQNEFGRPLIHGAFSPTYPLSWLVFQVTSDPWVFITIFNLSLCFLSGIFIILLCREFQLVPLAALIAGVSFTFSLAFMYWLVITVFLTTWCWTVAALWAVTRMAKKKDLLSWSFLAFSGYSLLATGYPQLIVYYIYLLGGYTIYLAYHKLRISYKELGKFLGLTISSLLVAALLAAPLYLDIIVILTESARVSIGPSSFLSVLPKITTAKDFFQFIGLSITPEFFLDPFTNDFLVGYRKGISFTVFTVFFAILGLTANFKKTWGWGLAIVVTYLLVFIIPVFLFAFNYLGFNLSRICPLRCTIIPVTICAAFGLDAVFRPDLVNNISKSLKIALGCIIILVVVGFLSAYNLQIPLNWSYLIGVILILGLFVLQYKKIQPVLLFLSLIITLCISAYPLMFHQSLKYMAKTSPLVEKMQESMPTDSRYAFVDPDIVVLPANLNNLVNIASAHSYNSLSSGRYHVLIKNLGGQVKNYGGDNKDIYPDYSGTAFWLSNIGLILSKNKVEHENLEYVGEEAKVHLHKVKFKMGESVQVVLEKQLSPELESGSGSRTLEKLINFERDPLKKLEVPDPRTLAHTFPRKTKDLGDLLEFEVKLEDKASIFILSQKYHRDWQASVLSAENMKEEKWQPAETLEINGVFQGVALPANSSRVLLEFKPYARFAWIAHVFWILLLVIFIGNELHEKLKNNF